MLWDLGVARRDMLDEDILRQRIAELDREFDQARCWFCLLITWDKSQVLILEKLDEGLVMLADNLCWPLKQVVTGKLNARSPDRVQKLEGAARWVPRVSNLSDRWWQPGFQQITSCIPTS